MDFQRKKENWTKVRPVEHRLGSSCSTTSALTWRDGVTVMFLRQSSARSKVTSFHIPAPNCQSEAPRLCETLYNHNVEVFVHAASLCLSVSTANVISAIVISSNQWAEDNLMRTLLTAQPIIPLAAAAAALSLLSKWLLCSIPPPTPCHNVTKAQPLVFYEVYQIYRYTSCCLFYRNCLF